NGRTRDQSRIDAIVVVLAAVTSPGGAVPRPSRARRRRRSLSPRLRAPAVRAGENRAAGGWTGGVPAEDTAPMAHPPRHDTGRCSVAEGSRARPYLAADGPGLPVRRGER